MHRHSDREMRITVNCKLKTVIQVINYKNTEIQILSIWMHCKPSSKVHFVNKSINKFPFQICFSFYKVMNLSPDCSYSTLIEVTWPNVNKIEPFCFGCEILQGFTHSIIWMKLSIYLEFFWLFLRNDQEPSNASGNFRKLYSERSMRSFLKLTGEKSVFLRRISENDGHSNDNKYLWTNWFASCTRWTTTHTLHNWMKTGFCVGDVLVFVTSRHAESVYFIPAIYSVPCIFTHDVHI